MSSRHSDASQSEDDQHDPSGRPDAYTRATKRIARDQTNDSDNSDNSCSSEPPLAHKAQKTEPTQAPVPSTVDASEQSTTQPTLSVFEKFYQEATTSLSNAEMQSTYKLKLFTKAIDAADQELVNPATLAEAYLFRCKIKTEHNTDPGPGQHTAAWDILADAKRIIELAPDNLRLLTGGLTYTGIGNFKLRNLKSSLASFQAVSSTFHEERWGEVDRCDTTRRLLVDAEARSANCKASIEVQKSESAEKLKTSKGSNEPQENPEEEEEEEIETAILEEYKPSINTERPHPTTVTLSANMAFASKTHRITEEECRELIDKTVLQEEALSDVQLEAVAMATKANLNGFAFCNGDSTGIGKGRTAMGYIKNARAKFGSKRCVYLSVNHTFPDVQRDYRDVNMACCGHLTNVADVSFKGKKIRAPGGILYIAHSRMVNVSADKIAAWLEPEEGAPPNTLVVDEVHRCNNIKTQVGKHFERLLQTVSAWGTRVLFMSATFATTVDDFKITGKYLDLFENAQFHDFGEFKKKVDRLGVSGLEAVSGSLAASNLLISRQLSLHGVGVERRTYNLTEEQVAIHTQLCGIFEDIARLDLLKKMFLNRLRLEFFQAFDAICRAEPLGDVVEECLQAGKSVVITTLKTGESSTRRVADKIFKEDKRAKEQAQRATRMLFRSRAPIDVSSSSEDEREDEAEDTPADKSENTPETPEDKPADKSAGKECDAETSSTAGVSDVGGGAPPANTKGQSVSVLRDMLETLFASALAEAELNGSYGMISFILDLKRTGEKINLLGPPTALDYLYNRFSGELAHVAELTGRSVVNLKNEDGIWRPAKLRNNISEQIRFFQSGRGPQNKVCRLAFLSSVASTGTSLHHTSPHTGPRVMIALGLGWSPESVLQTYGRVNRSNQLSSPTMILMSSSQLAMARFTAVVEARMKILGAITTSARDSRSKLAISDDGGDYFSRLGDQSAAIIASNEDIDLGSTGDEASRKFMNALLAMPVEKANELFLQFEQILYHKKREAKRQGKGDTGITPLLTLSENPDSKATLVKKHETSEGGPIYQLNVDKGVSWDEILEKKRVLIADGLSESGFKFVQARFSPPMMVNLIAAAYLISDKVIKLLRPHGNVQTIGLDEFTSRYASVPYDAAKVTWENLYVRSSNSCFHINCKNASRCNAGKRKVSKFVAPLPAFWALKEADKPPKMVRIEHGDDKFLGIEVEYDAVKKTLGA